CSATCAGRCCRRRAMADNIEIKVPDIGGYDDVPVIEVLVAVGDTVAKDQGLVTLESEKATMEVPSSAAGVVKELKVKVGDNVSAGAVIAVLEADAAEKPVGAALAPRPVGAALGRDRAQGALPQEGDRGASAAPTVEDSGKD